MNYRPRRGRKKRDPWAFAHYERIVAKLTPKERKMLSALGNPKRKR